MPAKIGNNATGSGDGAARWKATLPEKVQELHEWDGNSAPLSNDVSEIQK